MTPAAGPSILIVLMGSIGDVARGLCLPPKLKEAFAACRITWLVEPKCRDLVAHHAAIDEVLVFERRRGVAGIFKLWRELKTRRFDITLDLQRHFKSGFFSWVSGAERRLGFHPRNAKEFNWLFNNEWIEFCSEEKSKIQHYLLFLKSLLGVDGVWVEEAYKNLSFGLEDLDPNISAPGIMKRCGSSYVVLVLGSSWESKDWFKESYLDLARLIKSQTAMQVVLMGDAAQAGLAREISGALEQSAVINLAGETTLWEACALLKGAKAAIGPDSGPGHIAAAVGTPYIALFGPTAPERTAPYGCEHLVMRSKVSCSPCYRRRCPGLNKICLRLIGAEAVMERLKEVLNSGAAGRIRPGPGVQ